MKSPPPEGRKSWRNRLACYSHLPDVKPIPERMQKRFGVGTIVTPSPLEVDEAMRRVPEGRLVTVFGIGEQLARDHGATVGCTVTTTIFASMAAKAAMKTAGEVFTTSKRS